MPSHEGGGCRSALPENSCHSHFKFFKLSCPISSEKLFSGGHCKGEESNLQYLFSSFIANHYHHIFLFFLFFLAASQTSTSVFLSLASKTNSSDALVSKAFAEVQRISLSSHQSMLSRINSDLALSNSVSSSVAVTGQSVRYYCNKVQNKVVIGIFTIVIQHLYG